MEAQLQRPSHGNHGHEVAQGEVDGEHHHHHHGEKKSVLKKVKDKAKKIKDTIKKHGHHHIVGIHRHQETEEEEDVVNDPEIHGAPIYQSTVVRSMDLPRGANPNLDKEEDKHKQHVNIENPQIEGKPKIPDEDNHTPTKNQEAWDSSNKPLSESASEYAHKFAETIAPLYDKVAGEGEAMKGYLAEKFRPGEEEKALSEAITEELHKRKEAVWGAEEEEEEQRGKVTVSKEVADRLGRAPHNKREGEDAYAAGEESSGQGVGERLTDAVSLWLGKSTAMQTAKDSVGNSFVDNASGGGGGCGSMSQEK